jgi:hypothetical protein
VKLEKIATITYKGVQHVYCKGTISRPQVFVWVKQFEDGRKNITDNERSGSLLRTDPNQI